MKSNKTGRHLPALVFLLLSLFSLFSCGIEGVEATYNLNPPLGLSASYNSNNNTIVLYFWHHNTEAYFDGYAVYINPNAGIESSMTASNEYQLMNSDETNYTFAAGVDTTTSGAQQASWTIQEYVTNIGSTTPVPINANEYYLWVRAVSTLYGIKSLPSEVLKVTRGNYCNGDTNIPLP